MFAWYWLADHCQEKAIPFVLGHALYMKAIHGSKAKTDKIDAKKIAGAGVRMSFSGASHRLAVAARATGLRPTLGEVFGAASC